MRANEFEKEKAEELLNLWIFLDFFNQDKFPGASGKSGDLSWSEFASGQKRRKNCQWPEWLSWEDDQSRLADFFAKNAGDVEGKTLAQVDLLVGKVSSSDLARKVAKGQRIDSDDKVEAQRERSEDIAALRLSFSGEGSLAGVEISPLLWVAGSKGADLAAPEALYEDYGKDCERIKGEDYGFDKGDCRLCDVFGIVQKEARPLARQLYSGDEQRIDANVAEIFQTVLVRYYFKGKKRKLDYGEPLCRRYYIDDLLSLKNAFKSDNAEKLIKSGAFGAALDYMSAALNEHRRPDFPIDLFPNDCDNEKKKIADFFERALAFGSMPFGKWPSEHSLSMMQQVAVNLAVGRDVLSGPYPANDIVSVNGPPGTGKTTLLKDVIAANIVEKAILLCECQTKSEARGSKDPLDALFEEIEFPSGKKGYIKGHEKVYRIADGWNQITDLGIVVCSANNNAVFNVTGDLLQGIDRSLLSGSSADDGFSMEWSMARKPKKKEALDDIYFSLPADVQARKLGGWKPRGDEGSDEAKTRLKKEIADDYKADKTNPGMLLAACLGNSSNERAFYNDVLNVVLYATREDRGKELARARKSFIEQLRKVKSVYDGLGSKEEGKRLLAKRRAGISAAEKHRADVASRIDEQTQEAYRFLRENDATYRVSDADVVADLRAAIERIDEKLAEKRKASAGSHGLVSSIKSFFNKDAVALEENPVDEIAADLEKQLSRGINCRDSLEALRAEEKAAKDRLAILQSEEGRLLAEEKRLSDWLNAKGASSIEDVPAGGWDGFVSDLLGGDDRSTRSAHLFNPTSDNDLCSARDELFYWALQYTREVLLQSPKFMSNLWNLYALHGGQAQPLNGAKPILISYKRRDKAAIEPALFQTLNLLAPVVSTTLASASRAFRAEKIDGSAGKPPIGLLVVDEAGQAEPYCVLGMMARSRRALVVGDPSQLRPIANPVLASLRDNWPNRFPGEAGSEQASVQSVADVQNPVGHKNENGVWLGCPLIVHRRCESPMFDACNEISYDGLMVNETKAVDSPSYVYPASRWINIGGIDRVAPRQIEKALQIVTRAFEVCPEGTLPSIFVITPFRKVCNRLKAKCPEGVSEDSWKKFKQSNIGTIHTFQGKEADEVVFVLGGGKSNNYFVDSNMVNVAVSRAKRRLYVIGDYGEWEGNEPLDILRRHLDTAWVPAWAQWQESGGSDAESLRLARDSAPHAASIPGMVDIAEDAAANSKARVADGGVDEAADNDDEADLSAIKADAFVKNVQHAVDGLPHGSTAFLSDEQCSRYFGFQNEAEIDETFAGCGMAAQYLKQGIALFYLFGLDAVCDAEDQKETLAGAPTCAESGCDVGAQFDDAVQMDWSFVLVMFYKAAEAYFGNRLLPPLKNLANQLEWLKERNFILKKDCLTLGQYQKPLDEAAFSIGLRMGAASGADADGGQENPGCCCADWWKDLAKRLNKTSQTRNDAGHGAKGAMVDESAVKEAIGELFGSSSGEKPLAQADACGSALCDGILHQDAAFQLFGEAAELPLKPEQIAPQTKVKVAGENGINGMGAALRDKRLCDDVSKEGLEYWARQLSRNGEAEPGSDMKESIFVAARLLERDGYLEVKNEDYSHSVPTELGAAKGIRWMDAPDGRHKMLLTDAGKNSFVDWFKGALKKREG